MNEKQRRFAEMYAANPNATEAAKAAGYSPRTAYSQGQRMLKNVEIVTFIRQIQERLASERIASVEEVKTVWTATLRSPTEKTKDRLRAGELLARSAGVFTNAQPEEKRPAGAVIEEEVEEVETTKVMLPYDGSAEPNAVELPDGTIKPLAGAEEADILIYIQTGRA